MSEQEGPQGVQGEQGVRGLQGPTGQGVEGETGAQGAPGEKGERGAAGPLTRRVTLSFLAVIAVATLITLFQWNEYRKLDHTTERLEQEIQVRCSDARLNRVLIRETVIDGLAVLGYRYDEESMQVVPNGHVIDYYRTHPEEQADAVGRAKKTLARFPTITCEGGN